MPSDVHKETWGGVANNKLLRVYDHTDGAIFFVDEEYAHGLDGTTGKAEKSKSPKSISKISIFTMVVHKLGSI